jgi:hypothetical protein
MDKHHFNPSGLPYSDETDEKNPATLPYLTWIDRV